MLRALVSMLLGLAVLSGFNAVATSAERILLASTTSLDNSGFYEHLLPHFTADTGIVVSVIAVGTGKAIAIAKKGDADLLVVHDRKAELAFVGQGYGHDCTAFMYNRYVVVGPPANPAGIRRDMTLRQVMRSIVDTRSRFISRGDQSGTHKRELTLWSMADLQPSPKFTWYYDVGRGMGTVLTMANELSAYTLSDYATWLSFNHRSNLVILFDSKRYMYNPYSVILVDAKHHPKINSRGARRFADWLRSTRSLQLIADFKVQGQQVFTPIPVAAQKPCNLVLPGT